MTRWSIEKSGTGIEKSGTGIEKSGTGIEKSGTGIEKSGTGIEKSGTGISRFLLTSVLTSAVFASTAFAQDSTSKADPRGSLNIVAENGTVAVSWIIDGSVFSGVSSLHSDVMTLPMTELRLKPYNPSLDIAGGGSGTEIAGGGSGDSTQIAGGGSGGSTQIAGGGSGGSKNIAGGGSGGSKHIAGGGSGGSTQIAGGGSGNSKNIAGGGSGTEIAGGGSGTEIAGGGSGIEIAGGGSGSTIEIAGGGSGTDAFTIHLPQGTGMTMEVEMGCGFANITVLDNNFKEVVYFDHVPVSGNDSFCADGAFNDANFGDGYFSIGDRVENDR